VASLNVSLKPVLLKDGVFACSKTTVHTSLYTSISTYPNGSHQLSLSSSLIGSSTSSSSPSSRSARGGTTMMLVLLLIIVVFAAASSTSNDACCQSLTALRDAFTASASFSAIHQSITEVEALLPSSSSSSSLCFHKALGNLGSAYQMVARRLSEVEGMETISEEMLIKAGQYFSDYWAGKDLLITESASPYSSCSLQDFPSILPQILLRSWGDSIRGQFSDPKNEVDAMATYEFGVDAGFWRVPECRPIEISPKPPSERVSKVLFDIEDFAHVVEPIISNLEGIREELLASLTRAKIINAAAGEVIIQPSSSFAIEQLQVDDRSLSSEGWFHESAGLVQSAGRSWIQNPLIVNGAPRPLNCKSFPLTCSIFMNNDPLKGGGAPNKIHLANNGQVKFSLMQPGTIIRRHAGYDSSKLRMHCTILNPRPEGSWMIVKGERVHWREGTCFVFDETCDHEVFIADGDEGGGEGDPRVVLIIDVPSPFTDGPLDYINSINDPNEEQGLREWDAFHRTNTEWVY
jgi:hypothetical protein